MLINLVQAFSVKLRHFSFLNGINYHLLCIDACFERDNDAVSKISSDTDRQTDRQTDKTIIDYLRMR